MSVERDKGHNIIEPFSSQLLSKTSKLTHGFFSRHGGVSSGLYKSLNCGFGSGDDPVRIKKNRELALATLNLEPKNLVTTFQEHGNKAVQVKHVWDYRDAPKADALVTNQRGITIGILTADCVPILLVDGAVEIIGAAHAGWRGAYAGIVDATIDSMVNLGANPSKIRAAIGPCIGSSSYEVGTEFFDLFSAENKDNESLFSPSIKPNHFQFDLSGYIVKRLQNTGISSIDLLELDTFAEEESLYSYRRSISREERDYGRLLSVISLRD